MYNANFSSYYELALKMDKVLNDCLKKDEYSTVCAIAYYEDARKIIKELIGIGYDIANVEITSEETNMYADEYIISIDDLDGEYQVWCEPMNRDGSYIVVNAENMAFLMGNVSDRAINSCGTVRVKVNIK